MKPKSLLTITLLGGTLAGMALGLGATRLLPPAQAAPVKAAPKEALPVLPVGSALADVFAGKTYSTTLAAEKIDSTYHLVALVDAQGKPSLLATRGETFAAAGETFLVCYEVPLTNAQSTDARKNPPQPKAGTVGTLICINLRSMQAMGGIIPIASADAPIPASGL